MKRLFCVIPLVFLLCFVVGCQDKAAMEELEKFRAQATLEEQNKEIVKRGMELWGKGDFEAWKELVAPDYVWYIPSRSAEPLSREETIEAGKMMIIAFPDVSFSIEEMIAVGDKVITRYIVRGTHQGEYQGIPATGNKLESSGIMISRIENGKVVEDREESDHLGMMQQLGMELRPKEVEK